MMMFFGLVLHWCFCSVICISLFVGLFDAFGCLYLVFVCYLCLYAILVISMVLYFGTFRYLSAFFVGLMFVLVWIPLMLVISCCFSFLLFCCFGCGFGVFVGY